METTKKYFKQISLFMLLFAALGAVRIILDLVLGVDVPTEAIPDGMTESMVRVTMIAASVFGFIFLLPQVYVGVKGLKFAEQPDDSKGHFVWATIMLVLSVLSAISTLSGMIGSADLLNSILALTISICDIALYALYNKYGKALAKAR